MELIDQHAKKIMEGCKERARDAGLSFQDETLEYIVTNRDLIELSPKVMIPTMYDYWVHDVEVLKEKGKYEVFPHNPYETVINTRPAISFYNDNNPDWLNVMIFYHVLGHIDFFQNNLYFRQTWDYDFTSQALSDKRAIASLRSEHGRWVDYIIEFARGIDNMVGFHSELSQLHRSPQNGLSGRVDYYFDIFLQTIQHARVNDYIKEIERYNTCIRQSAEQGEATFFAEVKRKYPEFMALFEKSQKPRTNTQPDLMQYLLDHSEYLEREENRWMQTVIQVVRNTSMYFQPQIRTKIMNEGWASYWHEALFLRDDRISGHEVDFARVNARVTAMPRVGLNPYALGLRMFHFIEEAADQGRYSQEFMCLLNAEQRRHFDKNTGLGSEYIFKVRENLSDFLFIKNFLSQDFMTRYKLFVAGKRLNQQRMTWEYYVKSRKAGEYRNMVLEQLYHPPHIVINHSKCEDGCLYLVHEFEGKPLVQEYIQNTLLGIEFLWGNQIKLETREIKSIKHPDGQQQTLPGMGVEGEQGEPEIEWHRVLYTMKNRKLSKGLL